MTWSPPISYSYYPARWQSSRAGHGIVCIIVHSTVGTDSRAYLQRGGSAPDGSDRMVSIHVLIDRAGTIWRMVNDDQVANHAGYGHLTLGGRTYDATDGDPRTPSLNMVSLGVELENRSPGPDLVEPYPDPQLRALGWQIAAWRARFGALPIFRHADVDPARRRDPVGLTVAAIESWATRASAPDDAPANLISGAHDQQPRYALIVPTGVIATCRVAPDRSSAAVAHYPPGTALTADALVRGQPVAGDDRWWHLALEVGGRVIEPGFIHASGVRTR